MMKGIILWESEKDSKVCVSAESFDHVGTLLTTNRQKDFNILIDENMKM